MWFHLNLEGIDFHFQISRYNKSIKEIWDDQWCKVDLTLQSRNWLNYTISSDLLLSYEVEKLNKELKNLLFGKITSCKKLEFTEPNISLILNPKQDFYINDRNPDDKYEFDDITVELHIHLWEGVLTSNYISLCLLREDIEAMVSYLDSIAK